MKKIIFVLCALCAIATTNAQNRQQRLTDHVYFLASDSLQGRAAGSQMAKVASDYIIGQFEEIGIKPFFNGDYNHCFTAAPNHTAYHNVVGIIEGNDPQLKNEYIVIGAHYDHLGIKNGNIYNGADDNASGTAAVIEVARALKAEQGNLKRSVIVAAFDAEELGLYGSKALADTLDIDKVKLMMSIDMVGWLKEGKSLSLEGVATIRNGKAIITGQARNSKIKISAKNFENSLLTATDTEYFAAKGVPTLAVTTGIKSPYHKPEDDAELIDYQGLNLVSDYVTDLTVELANDDDFTASGRLSFKHKPHKRFEAGITAGYGSNHLHFKNGAVEGKAGSMYNLGITSSLHMGQTSLQLGLLYEKSNAKYPDESDLFGHSFIYRQEALTVPAGIILKTTNDMNAGSYLYIGAGGYYSRVLWSGLKDTSSDIHAKENQWGLQWSLGMKLYKYAIDFTSRYGMNDMMKGSTATAIRDRATCVSLRRMF